MGMRILFSNLTGGELYATIDICNQKGRQN